MDDAKGMEWWQGMQVQDSPYLLPAEKYTDWKYPAGHIPVPQPAAGREAAGMPLTKPVSP
jgi:hypothetical protein